MFSYHQPFDCSGPSRYIAIKTTQIVNASMIMLPDGKKEESKMCVVLIGRQQEVHPTQRRTHQLSPRLQASMIMLPNVEKEESKMCVVLIGC